MCCARTSPLFSSAAHAAFISVSIPIGKLKGQLHSPPPGRPPQSARPALDEQPAEHCIKPTPVTLRLRLTFWYSAVLAVIIALFGGVVYGLTVWTLYRQIDSTLYKTADSIGELSRLFPELNRLEIPEIDRFGAPGTYVQIWTSTGEWYASSANFARPPRSARPSRTDHHQPVDSRRGAPGAHLRVMTVPLKSTDGRLLGYIQAAAPLGMVDVNKSVLLLVLVGGGVAAVALAAVVGWMSAHRALKPLDTITQTALQISRADDLSRRIPLDGVAHDEVGRLAQAFNDTLERLERLFNAQRRFLADVSHELRTPLTTIRGNVDLLRRMGGADPTSLTRSNPRRSA